MVNQNFKIFLCSLVLIFICFFNMDYIYADSYDTSNFTAQFYDNYGPSLHEVGTSYSGASYFGIITLIAYTSGGAWGISSPVPLLANHTYSMTAEVYPQDCGNLILSTYNRIGVGNTMWAAKSSYENDTNVVEEYSNAVGNNLIQFSFTPKVNASYIVFAFATDRSCSSSQVFLTGLSFDDLGKGGVTQEEISSSLNNQLNLINSSITSSENRIRSQISEIENNINNRIDGVNENINNLNDNITDSNVDNATASSFFNGFQSDTFGLTSIITSPINLIASVTSSTCSPLPLQIPFLENQTLNLPCMSEIYQQYFGSFLTVYQIITFGIVSYWVCVKIFAMVKDFKNPEKDDIEVMDL